MDERRRRAQREGFDLAIGFLGFFTAAFFVITLIAEINRQEALGWAIATLCFGLTVWGIWLWRRSFLRRPDRGPDPD